MKDKEACWGFRTNETREVEIIHFIHANNSLRSRKTTKNSTWFMHQCIVRMLVDYEQS